jgi:hypothetical protein
VWAKCSESALFSIRLIDSNNRVRTFSSLEADGGSATTSWTRFAANLKGYSSQTSEFNISAVKSIDLYVYSNYKKSMTCWVDDLTFDTALNLTKSIYKARVLIDETVTTYFYTHMEAFPP